MIVEKRWLVLDSKFSSKRIKEITDSLDCSSEFAKILLQRGLYDPIEIKKFFDCKIEDLHDPFLLPDIKIFIDRIKIAMDRQEKVLVYGDYDVDGTVSATVLARAMYRMGFKKENVLVIAPHRKYGYGLSLSVVKGVARLGYSLIITCDCGSADKDAIELANSLKVDVMVTDHHQTIRHIKPLALVNPERPDSKYPFKKLCGAGVVFKILQALELSGEKIPALSTLDYIAMATVADVSPLIGENRIIAKHGMNKLSNTKQIPLRAMIESLSLDDRKINSETIGFMLAPRLNAPGRVSSANITMKFLLENDLEKAKEKYKKINAMNDKRKQIEAGIKEEAMRMLETRLNDRVLVLASDRWNKGVIGIVASVIKEYYTRPTVMISLTDGIGYGSIRNVSGFPLIDSLFECKDLLIRYGGHSMAAGITIKEENIQAFSDKMNVIANKVMPKDSLIPLAVADLKVNEKSITLDFVKELQKLEPFGQGNEVPMFIMEDVLAVEHEVRSRHLLLKLAKGKVVFNSPAFWMGEYNELMKDKYQLFDICFEANENVYNNNCYLQLLIKDLKEVKVNW